MSIRMRTSSNESSIASCGCAIALLITNIVLGAWSVNYLLSFFLAKTIPLLGAIVIGLFAGEVSVPVAIVLVVLRFFHVF